MADREGNVLRPPGFNQGVEVKGAEILGSYSHLTQKGLTILSGSGVLEAGMALKVSGTANKYEAAAKLDVAAVVGILRNAVDATDEDKLGNVVLSGVVKGAEVKYSDDADGLSGAELATLAGTFAGRYDAIFDYLIY